MDHEETAKSIDSLIDLGCTDFNRDPQSQRPQIFI